MTRASPCGPFIDAILDDLAPRTDGLERHLAGCPACRSLAAAHRGARALPASETPPLRPVAEREVHARVRRRRAVRLAGTAAAVAALVAVVLVPGPSRSPGPAVPRGDLFALADGVADLTQRDPLADDPALGALGAVSDWLAPPRARSFGFDSIAPPPRARAATGGDAP